MKFTEMNQAESMRELARYTERTLEKKKNARELAVSYKRQYHPRVHALHRARPSIQRGLSLPAATVPGR